MIRWLLKCDQLLPSVERHAVARCDKNISDTSFFPLWSPTLWQDVTRASLYSLAVFHCFPISCPNGAAWLPSRFRWVPAIQSKRLRDTQPADAGIVTLQSNDYLQSMTSAVQCSWLTTLDMQNNVPLHATTIIYINLLFFVHTPAFGHSSWLGLDRI